MLDFANTLLDYHTNFSPRLCQYFGFPPPFQFNNTTFAKEVANEKSDPHTCQKAFTLAVMEPIGAQDS